MSKLSEGASASDRVGRIASVKQFDALLFAAVLALTAVGYFFLYHVRQTYSDVSDFTEASMNRQLLSIILGIIAALLLSSIDYRYYQLPSYVAYIGSFAILVIVSFIGRGGSGSKLNITLFGVNFQPSEVMKIAFAVVASSFFERITEKRAKKSDYVKLALYTALPVGLIQLQKDTGTALVYLIMFAFMLFFAGIKYRYIFALFGAAVAAAPFIWNYMLNTAQKMRFMIFLNPELDITNAGWQSNLARSAISAGGFAGRQIARPSQAKYANIPERYTDFIFTVIAERTGFVGSVLLIALFVFVLMRCLYIASKACDRYGEFMVIALTSMIMFHFVENIGMCIGLMPITGIPLPFISYGGTAMIANYCAIGIILSVSVTRDMPGAHNAEVAISQTTRKR